MQRISQARRMPLPDRRRDQQTILVEPRGALLGLRQSESPFDECFGRRIELPDDAGIRATARRADQDTRRGSGSGRRRPPDPVLAFGLGQGIEVEQDLPVGLRQAIRCQRRAPPDPARMVPVLLDVVEEPAAPVGERQAVVAVEDGDDRIPIPLERSIGEIRQRSPGFPIDPGCRAGIVDALKPQARIVVRVLQRGMRIQILNPPWSK